jgi:hypothetical protein
MHANPRHNREATEFHVKNGKKMRFNLVGGYPLQKTSRIT